MNRTTEPRPTSCPAEMTLPDYEGDQPQDEGPEDTNSRRTLVRRVKWPARSGSGLVAERGHACGV